MQAHIKVNRKDCPGIIAETFAEVLNEMGVVKVTKLSGGEESTEYLIETLEGKDSTCSTGSKTSS